MHIAKVLWYNIFHGKSFLFIFYFASYLVTISIILKYSNLVSKPFYNWAHWRRHGLLKRDIFDILTHFDNETYLENNYVFVC